MVCPFRNPGLQLEGLVSRTPSAIDRSLAVRMYCGYTYVNLDRFGDKGRVGIEKPHIRLDERC